MEDCKAPAAHDAILQGHCSFATNKAKHKQPLTCDVCSVLATFDVTCSSKAMRCDDRGTTSVGRSRPGSTNDADAEEDDEEEEEDDEEEEEEEEEAVAWLAEKSDEDGRYM